MTLLGTWYTFYDNSGSNTPSSAGDFRWYFQVYLVSQSTANNSSVVRMTPRIQFVNMPLDYWLERTHARVWVNGSVVDNNYIIWGTNPYNTPSTNTTLTFSSTDRTIYHNSNGEGSFSFIGQGRMRYGATSPYYGSYRGTTNPNISLPTIPRYANITSFSATADRPDRVSISWATNATCDRVQVSTNGGSSYSTVSGQSGTSGSFTVTGLNPNTTYQMRIRVRRSDSQLQTQSSTLNRTTHKLSTKTSSRNFNIGNDIPLTINRQNSNYTHTVRLRCRKNSSESWTLIKTMTSVGSSGTMSLTQAEKDNIYTLIPNQNTCQTQFEVETFRGSTSYGTTTNTGTATVVNSNPIFSDFTYEDINATTLALTNNNQAIVKGYSNGKVTVIVANKAVAQNSATMVKYRFLCGTQQIEENYSSDTDVELTLSAVNNTVFRVYAIDSRGNSTYKDITVSPFISYTDVNILSGSLSRGDGGVGEETTLDFNGEFWNDDFGDGNNIITSAKYRYKKTTDASYGSWSSDLTTTPSGNTYLFSGTIIGDKGANGFDVLLSYNIQVEVKDELSTTTYNLILTSGTPSLALHQEGIAINAKYDDTKDAGLQVTGKIYQDGIEFKRIIVSSEEPSDPSENDLWLEIEDD